MQKLRATKTYKWVFVGRTFSRVFVIAGIVLAFSTTSNVKSLSTEQNVLKEEFDKY